MTRRRLPIHLTRVAEQDLNDIHDFIAAESTERAVRAVDLLLSKIAGLAEFPGAHPIAYETRRGRPLRHLVMPPFRVVYEIKARRVIVMAIRHTRRLPENL